MGPKKCLVQIFGDYIKLDVEIDIEWREVSNGFESLPSQGFCIWAKQEQQNIYSIEIGVYEKFEKIS